MANITLTTSSKRAHYYEHMIDPLNHFRVTRESRRDLMSRDNVIFDLPIRSVYNQDFAAKYWIDQDCQDLINRFSTQTSNLRFLHEKFMTNPVMPMKHRESSTGLHHVTFGSGLHIALKINRLSMPRKSPIKESTRPIRVSGREEIPPVLANVPSHSKHLDIFVSTSNLAHPQFTVNQQNGVARKDIKTFYDMGGTPKSRGFGPKDSTPVRPYFHRDKTEPDKVRVRSTCAVPYFGKTSEYKAKYLYHGLTNMWHEHEEISFPPVCGPFPFDILAVPAMYCTETCHLGTGWPVSHFL